MALDTNLTPEIVNSFNVYIDGVKAIGTAPEITLPQITSETIDVSGSGILGKSQELLLLQRLYMKKDGL